jgi:large repetitive protein
MRAAAASATATTRAPELRPMMSTGSATGNRSTNRLASADAYTNHAGYQVRVPAGSEGNTSVLSSKSNAGTFQINNRGDVDVVLPNDTFTHTRQDATVSLQASQANGRPLPNWLKFDSQTGKFSGTPPEGFGGDLAITVSARDSSGQRADTAVKLSFMTREVR